MGSYALGRQVGDAVLKRMASQAIIAAKAAVGAQTSLIKDITGETTKTANMLSLVETRGLWGDQMTKLAAWLMHSKPYLDLVKDGLENYKLESVAGVSVLTGDINPAVGGPLVISDNSNLYTSGSPNTYDVIGIATGGVIVRQSQLQEIFIEKKTGLEQLAVEIQGEYAVTVSVAGYTWDVTNGGVNPTDATLGTTTNWDKQLTDVTGLPLVKLYCQ